MAASEQPDAAVEQAKEVVKAPPTEAPASTAEVKTPAAPAQAEAAAPPAAVAAEAVAPPAAEPATLAVPATSSSAPAAPAEATAGAATASSAPSAGTKPAKPAKAAKAAKAAATEAPVSLKPATSSREDNLIYDLQKMSAFDIAPLHPKVDFLAYTRDSVQMLVNKMFTLPRSDTEAGTSVELPEEATFKLPRQKPVPKIKPKTRWQKFMEDRNMRKRKRSRLVWDEVSQDWKPRWGYKSIKKSQASTEWVHEVKEGQDPMENPFERKNAEKKLLQARQKMREVRNKVEAAGGKMNAAVPDLSFGGQKRGAEGLKEAIKRAQVSSASFGKFDRVAPNEATNLQPKSRKVNTVTTPEEERSRYLKAATRCLSSEGPVDKEKAAKAGLREQSEGPAVPRKATQKGRKGTPGSGRRSKQGAKRRKGGKR